MIKFSNLPAVRGMATQATRYSVGFKLAVMSVSMAIGAARRQASKLLDYFAIGILPEMACTAALPGMRSGKRKGSNTMVEPYLAPGFHIVAALAIVFRIVFCVEEIFVYVGMTINTVNSDLTEIPFFLFFMAGNTRCSKMRPGKLKVAVIMLLNGE